MALSFSQEYGVDYSNPYLDWSVFLSKGSPGRLAANQGSDGRWFPVFVRPASGVDRAAFFSSAKADPAIRFDPLEQDGLNPTGPQADPLEVLLYVKEPSDTANGGEQGLQRSWYQIIHIGAPTHMEQGGTDQQIYFDDTAVNLSDKIAIGVIDDGIAFLNRRFSFLGRTRFRSLWLQRLAQATSNPSNASTGRFLHRAEIQVMLDQTEQKSELDLYRGLNEEVFSSATFLPHTVELPASHGTHVLDAAAGNDPYDPAAELAGHSPADVEIFGVQLPAEVVDDTSGRRLQIYAVQAVRWMWRAARRAGHARLVINLSFGMVAGAKDGNGFFEQQIEAEISKAATHGLDVDIVLPYGNDFEGRLIGGMTLSSSLSSSVELVVQADDATASYVELHDIARLDQTNSVTLQLRSPDGQQTGVIAVAPGMYRSIIKDGVEVGRVYNQAPNQMPGLPRQQPARIVVAFAPSTDLPGQYGPGGVPILQDGRWRLNLASTSVDDVSISVQCQRDDTSVGYPVIGRQMILEDAKAFEWNERAADYTGLSPDSVLTYEGTNNALAIGLHPNLHLIGAANTDLTGAIVPARYTAQGAPWSGGNPDAATHLEGERVFEGHLGSGNTTGSSARFDGTSVAAAIYSRFLLNQAGAGVPVPPQHLDRLGSTMVSYQ